MSRTLLLALVLTLSSVSSALAGTVVENPNFVFPPVPYSFSTATNTFTGQGSGGFVGAPVLDGDLSGTLNVTFTDLGEFVGGTFTITGAIPSLGIPAGSLVMQGDVTGIAKIEADPEHFAPFFDLEVNMVNPLLGFDADIGTWIAEVCNPTGDCGEFSGGPTSIADLFTTDYTDSHMPLNTFVFTSHHVPYPTAGLLFGLGLALLAARQRLHWS